MTTMTLQVPNELAAQLAPLRHRLPQLLATTLELFPPDRPWAVPTPKMLHPAFNEMIDFLVSGPTPQQIIAFKISSVAQDRLDELLDKNRENGLIESESAELDLYEQINHVFLLLKARARSAKAGRP